ncbi:ABC transporter permease [Tropicimonas isoalkanivorans]|uniref:Iron(III) transport system permease protein n=1 Tax=Tropicimonas isoalkanivorans TaxID=441112 RepID=A0A1I1FZ85_9RHOB|nr:iron ABC transporter permease [Tropicimonas isoalkanivorans]SFC04346.1 iron(III) transport system permease protein [Tropicimonas isoalkanivorans]
MSARPSALAERFATGLLRGGAIVVAALCLLPMAAVLVAALLGSTDTLRHLADTVLWRYSATTLQLVLIVAAGTAAIGTGAAWLVTMTRFPGSRIFEIALALPLAFPAYVMGYAYTHFLDHPGPVQTLLRDVTGWGPRDYWFPEVRSVTGAAVMLILVLYPYVYLLARAAFLQQSATAFLAARALGRGPWTAFFRVSLPMARPAIAGGVLLAVMETIADYGTVSYFSVQTFATGIYTSWFTMADRAAAAQLALCLLSVALLLALAERLQRGAARHHGAGKRFERLPPTTLTGAAKWAALAVCAAPVLFGFALPVTLLFTMGLGSEQSLLSPRYLAFTRNTIILAGTASVLTVLAAILVGFRQRLWPGRTSSGAGHIARIGYAVPGGVIAVGLLVPFAAIDNGLDAWMRQTFGLSTGLLFTGSIWLLVCAYLVRFLAAALNAYDSGLGTVHPNIDAVSRTLGTPPLTMLRRIHLPILRPSVLTALLIVFVDVMKELPATLIMRPFNFDTLAVQAHRLASDERLEGAAVPSLVIVAVGLLPVILVCRSLGAQRSRVYGPAPVAAE